MPNLHDAGLLKKMSRILEESGGPKLSSRLINGFEMSVTMLELCYELLEKMTGHKWRLWRDESGQSFKQALRERVERVLSGRPDGATPRTTAKLAKPSIRANRTLTRSSKPSKLGRPSRPSRPRMSKKLRQRRPSFRKLSDPSISTTLSGSTSLVAKHHSST